MGHLIQFQVIINPRQVIHFNNSINQSRSPITPRPQKRTPPSKPIAGTNQRPHRTLNAGPKPRHRPAANTVTGRPPTPSPAGPQHRHRPRVTARHRPGANTAIGPGVSGCHRPGGRGIGDKTQAITLITINFPKMK